MDSDFAHELHEKHESGKGGLPANGANEREWGKQVGACLVRAHAGTGVVKRRPYAKQINHGFRGWARIAD
jgi:hypothetical protein